MIAHKLRHKNLIITDFENILSKRLVFNLKVKNDMKKIIMKL